MSLLFGRPALSGRAAAIRGALLLAALTLACLPLSILLAGNAWWQLPLFGAGPVILAGILVRQVARGTVLVPLLQLIVVGAVTIIAALGQGVASTADGPSGILSHVAAAITGGIADLGAASPPVPVEARATVVLVLALALAGIALDLMFVDLGWHTPTAIALLTIALVPAIHVPSGGAWWVAAAPIAAACALLATRTLHADPTYVVGDTRPQAGPLPRPVATTAATLAVLAIITSLAVPLGGALPALSPARAPLTDATLRGIGGGGTGGGGGPTMIHPDASIERLLRQETRTELLMVSTDIGDPGYLRLRALNRFDGSVFSPSDRDVPDRPTAPSDARLTGIAPGDQAPLIDTRIQFRGFASTSLPIPEQLRGIALESGPSMQGDAPIDVVPELGEVHVDYSRFPDAMDRIEYTATSVDPAQDAAALRADGPAPHQADGIDGLQISRIPKRAARLADQVASDAGATNAYDTAVAFQDYFRNGFDYSLTAVTPPGADPLDSFLDDKVGYCEQFASTFALMMNARGYPTRVVVGFTGGHGGFELAGHSASLITTENAHAWPEVWFGPRHGWVRFEPTPAAAANGVTVPPTVDPAEETSTPAAEPTPEPTTPSEEPTPSEQPSTPASPTPGAAQPHGSRATGLISTIAAIGAIAVLVAAAAGGVVLQRRRRARARDRAWEQAGADGPDALAETAWSEIRSALIRRSRAVRWLGWTGRWGRPPVRLALDPALGPTAALTSLVASEEAAEAAVGARAHGEPTPLDVPAGTPVADPAAPGTAASGADTAAGTVLWEDRARAAERIGRAVTRARYAAPGAVHDSSESSAPGAAPVPATERMRRDADLLVDMIRSRPQRRR